MKDVISICCLIGQENKLNVDYTNWIIYLLIQRELKGL